MAFPAGRLPAHDPDRDADTFPRPAREPDATAKIIMWSLAHGVYVSDRRARASGDLFWNAPMAVSRRCRNFRSGRGMFHFLGGVSFEGIVGYKSVDPLIRYDRDRESRLVWCGGSFELLRVVWNVLRQVGTAPVTGRSRLKVHNVAPLLGAARPAYAAGTDLSRASHRWLRLCANL